MTIGHHIIENGLAVNSSRFRQTGNALVLASFSDDSIPWGDVYAAFESDYDLHDRMLQSSSLPSSDAQMLCYLSSSTFSYSVTKNSSLRSVNFEAEAAYQRAEECLTNLRSVVDDDGDLLVEAGALDSASEVLRALHARELSPPQLSWHGGDAVVMLWGLGETTWAVTITEGELGYVIKRGDIVARFEHSIPVQAFRLEDLR